MGEAIVGEPIQGVAEAARSKIPLSKIGYSVLLLYLLFFLISLVMVFSTTEVLSSAPRGGNTWYYLGRQVMTFAVGFVLMLAVSLGRPSFYRRFDVLGVVLMLGLLLLTLKFGIMEKGARRALSVFGLFKIRPAEIASVPLIIYLSSYFSNEKNDLRTLRGVLTPVLVVGAFVGVVVVNSLSQALVLAVVGGVMLLMGRVRWLHMVLIVLLGAGGLAGYQAWSYQKTMHAEERGEATGHEATDRSKTRYNRFERWLNGTELQTEQSKMAIASGVAIGRGPGRNQLCSLLPESYSDFIFSIIVEEYGLPGAAVVMILYLVLLWRIFAVLKSSEDRYMQMVCGGVGVTIAVQVLIHVMVGVGFMPVTGITLPLISHGSTSLVVVSVLLGLVLSVNREIIDEKVPR